MVKKIILAAIKSDYCCSNVTSGEHIHSIKIPINFFGHKVTCEDVTESVQEFLNWDDSPEEFGITFVDDHFVVGYPSKCPVCGSDDIAPDPDSDSMTNCEQCGSEWITDTGEITLNGREIV